MTMYLVCSADIWHSQYLWCFSPWPSQIKRFIYEDTFMQDFLLVHLLKSEMVYSNIGLLWKLCWRVLLETVEKYYFCLFLPNHSLLQHSSAEVGLSVQLSQCPNIPQHGQPTLLQSQPILWSSSPMSTSSFRSISSSRHPSSDGSVWSFVHRFGILQGRVLT